MSLEQLGEKAGEAVNEAPFGISTMSRFLRGEATREVADAIQALTGIPIPADIEEPFSLWLELGQRLHAVNQRLYLEELRDMAELVERLERRVVRRKKMFPSDEK